MASVRKRSWRTGAEPKTAWIVDYRDNDGHRQRKHFSTKKAADKFRIDIEGQLQAGLYRAAADKVTIAEASASFLQYCEGRHRRDERMTRKMLVVYRGHVGNHILHAAHGIGALRLAQFTARSVGTFRDALRTASVSGANNEEGSGDVALHPRVFNRARLDRDQCSKRNPRHRSARRELEKNRATFESDHARID
jgi:hypothetical protein